MTPHHIHPVITTTTITNIKANQASESQISGTIKVQMHIKFLYTVLPTLYLIN